MFRGGANPRLFVFAHLGGKPEDHVCVIIVRQRPMLLPVNMVNLPRCKELATGLFLSVSKSGGPASKRAEQHGTPL
jgi:hypothetical protein